MPLTRTNGINDDLLSMSNTTPPATDDPEAIQRHLAALDANNGINMDTEFDGRKLGPEDHHPDFYVD